MNSSSGTHLETIQSSDVGTFPAGFLDVTINQAPAVEGAATQHINVREVPAENNPAKLPFDYCETPATFEHIYLDNLKYIAEYGTEKTDRTGTGTKSKNGLLMRFDLLGGSIPLLTTKQIYHKSFTVETVWFKNGGTDVEFLKKNGVNIWDDWVNPKTAKFEKTDKPNLSDTLTYLRCYHNDTWVSWRAYIAKNKITRPVWANFEEWVAEFIGSATRGINYGIAESRNMKLVSGSIGTGAYGSLWRNWEDTRMVPQNEVEKYRAWGYRFVTHVPGMHTAVITRNIDQLANAIHTLKTNPDSRRIIVSAWNPGRLEEASLPPCHTLFQFFSHRKSRLALCVMIAKGDEEKMHQLNDSEITTDELANIAKEAGHKVRELKVLLYMRSSDAPVGLPFNFAQYALLAHMVAHVTDHEATELIWAGGDVHIYQNQLDLVPIQLEREIKPHKAHVLLNPKVTTIDEFTLDDIKIVGYGEGDFHPAIPYPVAV